MKKVMTMALMALFTLSVSAQTPVNVATKSNALNVLTKRTAKRTVKMVSESARIVLLKTRTARNKTAKNKIARNKTAKNSVELLAKSSVTRSK